MPATPARENDRRAEARGPDPRDALVGAQVLRSLGSPPDLLLVQVRRLWGMFYRVNIFAGECVSSARVVHSHFVRADEAGAVLTADPAIARLY